MHDDTAEQAKSCKTFLSITSTAQTLRERGRKEPEVRRACSSWRCALIVSKLARLGDSWGLNGKDSLLS